MIWRHSLLNAQPIEYVVFCKYVYDIRIRICRKWVAKEMCSKRQFSCKMCLLTKWLSTWYTSTLSQNSCSIRHSEPFSSVRTVYFEVTCPLRILASHFRVTAIYSRTVGYSRVTMSLAVEASALWRMQHASGTIERGKAQHQWPLHHPVVRGIVWFLGSGQTKIKSQIDMKFRTIDYVG